MKKIRLLALLVLFFAFGTAMAQTVRVTGVVKSAEDGQPLPGVSVHVEGTNNGTGTAGDGSYSLNNVPSSGKLVFRYVGQKTQTIDVNGKTKVDVTMAPDILQAEEVTVTALNSRKQNRAIGYAATTVKGDDLARTNQVNPINALMGKVAGVQLQTSSSAGVTSSPSIVIRGAKSLTKNNSPIFVIDGIVMQNEESEKGSVGSSDGMLYGNQLKNLNQDDFESMTVLKGAAATSLYGSRGANGAIVITTKSGKVRKGLGIQASYTHEWQDMYAAPIELQNTYGMGRYSNGYEGDYNEGWKSTSSGYTAGSFGPRMDGQMMQQYIQGADSPLSPLVGYKDNWKALFQQGQYDNASIAITGGTNDVTYRLSYGFTKSQGILPNNGFSRHNLNFNTTGKINDVISINANVQYANSVTKNPQQSSPWAWEWSPLMLIAYNTNRNTDIRWVADNYIDPVTYERRAMGVSGNLLSWFNRSTDNNLERQEQTIIARIGVDFKFTDFLDASVSASINDFSYFRDEKNYGGSKYREGGSYGIQKGNSGQFNGLAQIHYGDRFLDDRLEVDVRVMSEIYGNTRSNYSSKNTNGGLITPGLFNFANSKNPLTTGDISASTTPRNNMTIGLAAVAALGWDNQIYLEVTARNDWVSSLLYPKWLPQGANNYSVFYPSVNASWVFSETFGIDPNILSLGKIRASWAQVGMGTGAFETASGGGGYSQGSVITPTGGSVINSNPNNTTLPNYDLKPEIQQSIEIGADLRFLNDRIGIDATWYKTNTFNQILKVTSTPESGVGNRLINAGNIQNQGWEFQLDFTPIRTREVNWNIAVNFTRNRGKIIELHDQVKYIDLMGSIDNGPSIRAFEGGAFGEVVTGNSWGGNPVATQNDPNKAHYGKQIIYRAGTAGSPNPVEVFQYLTTDNVNNYYNDTDFPGVNKYVSLGNISPDFLFGFNTTLSYKGFDLYVQIDGRKGGTVVTPLNRYAHSTGTTKYSLGGRDEEHGGVARKNYKGETVYNGIVLDGVFSSVNSEVTSLKTGAKVSLEGMTMQEAIDAGHIQAPLASGYWQNNYSWGCASDYHVQDLTYISLREVTLGYNFPEKWVKHIGMQSARLSFTARNLCYIYNGLNGKTNPESITNNNPLTPFDVSGIPFTRSFALTLNVRF